MPVIGAPSSGPTWEAWLHARVNMIGFRPDALPAAIERYRRVTLPLISGWPGYRGAMAMVQLITGRAFTLSLWETAENRDESGLRRDYIQDLADYGEMVSGAMARESYEVVTSTLRPATPADLTRRAWGRVTTGTVPREHWDAAIAMLTPMVEDEGDNRSHQGSMMLANQTLSKIVIIGVWDSRRAIVATDDEVHAQAYLVRRAGFLTASPVHEVYEIVAWA